MILFLLCLNISVCRHFKVNFFKFGTQCRHEHLTEECEVNVANKNAITDTLKHAGMAQGVKTMMSIKA